MKKLNLITTLLALLIVLMGCKKEATPTAPAPCSIVYSGWTLCTNNIQTRTYTSSPSGCTGTPPADSTQRSCTLFINDLPVTDIEGNIYNTVKLGNQTWTTKNLNVGKYRNGDPIPQVQDNTAWANLTTGAWCYYLNNTANGTTYGKLYNWYAVNDPRGLAPNGYHIPTDAEWTSLTTYLGGVTEAGTTMKMTSGWLNNGNGTNTSGFEGLPGGYLYTNGNFDGIGSLGYWWSSSELSANYAWFRELYYNNGSLPQLNSLNKHCGFSVRCIKD